MKKPLIIFGIIALIVLACYLYHVLRPTVIFHTAIESGYLGKVSTFSGSIDKLYTKNYKAKYRLPYKWKWNKDDEIAIFTYNYNDLLKKEDVGFYRLNIFLDENGFYSKHSEKQYFWSKCKIKSP